MLFLCKFKPKYDLSNDTIQENIVMVPPRRLQSEMTPPPHNMYVSNYPRQEFHAYCNNHHQDYFRLLAIIEPMPLDLITTVFNLSTKTMLNCAQKN